MIKRFTIILLQQLEQQQKLKKREQQQKQQLEPKAANLRIVCLNPVHSCVIRCYG